VKAANNSPKKKKKEIKKAAKAEKAVVENKAPKSSSSKRKKAAPVAHSRRSKTNVIQTIQASPKRAAAPSVKRTTAKANKTKVPEQPTLAGVETGKNATVQVTPAANSEEVGALDSTAADRAG